MKVPLHAKAATHLYEAPTLFKLGLSSASGAARGSPGSISLAVTLVAYTSTVLARLTHGARDYGGRASKWTLLQPVSSSRTAVSFVQSWLVPPFLYLV
jgi:hypothetical protein